MVLVMLAVAGAPEGAFAAVYHCRNLELEVRCDKERCERSEAFTPGEVLVDVTRREIEVCLYSGCWKGRGAVLRNGAAFLIAEGRGLRAPLKRDRADVAVVIDKRRLSGSVSAFGFVNPVSCERRS